MPPNLRPGNFTIVSLIEGNPPVGVGGILPSLQFVYLNAPVATWKVTKDGDNTYRFSIGGYPFTGVIDNKVAASVTPEQSVEWIATYREFQDAYTIVQAGVGRGWTVPSGSKPDSNAVIEIKSIIVLPAEPVKYPIASLFRFVPEVDEAVCI